jgi:hypothetical protein
MTDTVQYRRGQRIRVIRACQVGLVLVPVDSQGAALGIGDVLGRTVVRVQFDDIPEILPMWAEEIEAVNEDLLASPTLN